MGADSGACFGSDELMITYKPLIIMKDERTVHLHLVLVTRDLGKPMMKKMENVAVIAFPFLFQTF